MPPRRAKTSASPSLESPVNALFLKAETAGSTARSSISRKRPSSAEAGLYVQSNGKRTKTRTRGELLKVQEENGAELASEASKCRTTGARTLDNEVTEEEELSRMSGCNRSSIRRAGSGRPPVAPTQVSKSTTVRQSFTAQLLPSDENMFQKQTPRLRKGGPLSSLTDNIITPATQTVAKKSLNPTPAVRSSARLKNLNIGFEESVSEKKPSTANAKRNSPSELQPSTLKRVRKNVVENSSADISLGAKTRRSNSSKALGISKVEGHTPVPSASDEINTEISDPDYKMIHASRRRGRKCIPPAKSMESAVIQKSGDSYDQMISKEPTGSINGEDIQELAQGMKKEISNVERDIPMPNAISDRDDKTLHPNRRRGRKCIPGKSMEPAGVQEKRDSGNQISKEPTGTIDEKDIQELAQGMNKEISNVERDIPMPNAISDRDDKTLHPNRRRGRKCIPGKSMNKEICYVIEKMNKVISDRDDKTFHPNRRRGRKCIPGKSMEPAGVQKKGDSDDQISRISNEKEIQEMTQVISNVEGDAPIPRVIEKLKTEISDPDDKMIFNKKRARKCIPGRSMEPEGIQRKGDLDNQISKNPIGTIKEEDLQEPAQGITQGKLANKSQTRGKKTIVKKRFKSADRAHDVPEKANVEADYMTNSDSTLNGMLETKVRKKIRKSKIRLFDALPVGFGLGVSGYHPSSPLPSEIMPGTDVLQLVAEEHGNNPGMDQLVVIRYNQPDDDDDYTSITSMDGQIAAGASNITKDDPILQEGAISIINTNSTFVEFKADGDDSGTFSTSIRMMDEQVAAGETNITKDDHINSALVISKQEKTKPRKGTKTRRTAIKSLITDDETNGLTQAVVRRSSRNKK